MDALGGGHCDSTPCCARTTPGRAAPTTSGWCPGGTCCSTGSRRRPPAGSKRGMRVVVQLPVDPTRPGARDAPTTSSSSTRTSALAAIDKPSGMTVHPTGRIRHGTLINKLHARYRSDDRDADVVPRLAHRLDQDTSGVVLIVKNRRVDALVTEAVHAPRGREDLPRPRPGRPVRSRRVSSTRRWRAIPRAARTSTCTSIRTGQPAQSRWRVRQGVPAPRAPRAEPAHRPHAPAPRPHGAPRAPHPLRPPLRRPAAAHASDADGRGPRVATRAARPPGPPRAPARARRTR